MGTSNQLKLLNFFIFNPELSKSEGEEEKKILYYYPVDTPIASQVKTAGLCEAVVKFTASFKPDKPCQTFTTSLTKQMLLMPEDNFWVALTISAEKCDGEKGDPSDKIQENVFGSLLELSYKMYVLFNGSFTAAWDAGLDDGRVLKRNLEQFFESYLPSMKIDNCNILNIFHGIQYLPLARDQFLHVQSFVNTVEAHFTSIRHSVFLYNDHLIWSGLDPSDMQVLYQYLVGTLLPSHPDVELQGGSLPGNTVNYGTFVTGPGHLMDQIASTNEVPLLHLSCATGVSKYHLVVYRALSATLCLLVPEATDLSLSLFHTLETFIGPRLTNLVSEISEYCVRTSAANVLDTSAKFIYFNRFNMAIKHSTLESKKGGTSAVSPEILRLLASLNADSSVCCDNHEIMLKYPNDTWVVLKCSNGREFYVVAHKKQSMRDVTTEVKKICANQLKGIFFMS